MQGHVYEAMRKLLQLPQATADRESLQSIPCTRRHRSKPPCASIASFKSGIIRFVSFPARFVCHIVRTTRNSAFPLIIRE